MNAYDDQFYGSRNENTEYAADRILSLLLEVVPNVSSAIDIGCGVGTWLSVLKRKGVQEIQGVDGDWVNRDLLVIPVDNFLPGNLVNPPRIDKKFDLAICLEVAEHLPGDNARDLVIRLTNLADLVLFSAAIPFQGGTSHVNEQWPEYWENLFSEKAFIGLDIIRRCIWDNKKIPFYYRQNILLFTHKNRVNELNFQQMLANVKPIALIHPEAYLEKINKYRSLKGSWKLYRNALKKRFKSRWRAKP